ncbi:MAG TPA: hypothetical protein VME18_10550 [Acidobacteriaceae bacterium]|nr:hypothetical protein [Acidobacteriaceae bacterium]
MSAGSVLKSYLWWTYERGSVPYDVMVTLILAFIFLTPLFIHYGDQPKPDWPSNEIRAMANPAGGLIYIVPAEMAPAAQGAPSSQQLASAIARVAGPVTIDRSQPIREIGGGLVAWKVWAHR